MRNCLFQDWGRTPYAEAWARQTERFEAILAAKADKRAYLHTLVFCEHPPVLTIGRSGNEANLLVPRLYLAERGIDVQRVDRGVDITYHAPGQAGVYPIFDLEQLGLGLREYVHALEEIVIRFLRIYGLEGQRLPGATGVWIGVPERPRKICAIGVRSSRFVVMHGLALNINTDLAGFSMINPCGFTDKGVTSLASELGAGQDFALAKSRLFSLLADNFQLRVVW